MTIEEIFQDMIAKAYPPNRDPGSSELSKQQIIDLRRAFFGGCLIGFQASYYPKTNYDEFYNELMNFLDLVDAGLR